MKNNKLVKIIFFSLFSLLSSNLVSYANEMNYPLINFNKDRVIGKYDNLIFADSNERLANTDNDPNQPMRSIATFQRNIGKSKNELKNFHTETSKILSSNFSYNDTYKNKLLNHKEKAEYVIDSNSIIKGYYLLDFFNISNFKTYETINKIKALSKYNSYLDNIKLPNDIKMNIYKVDRNDGFIEIYGILDTLSDDREYLYLDAFYPKDNELEKHFKEELKNNLTEMFIKTTNDDHDHEKDHDSK